MIRNNKITKALMTAAAALAMLLSAGAPAAQTSNVYARTRYHRVVRRRRHRRRTFHALYLPRGQYYTSPRDAAIYWNRGKKCPLHSRYVESIIAATYGSSPYEQPRSYAGNPRNAIISCQLDTSAPKVYIAPSARRYSSEIRQALAAWRPQIRGTFTSSRANANVVIQASNNFTGAIGGDTQNDYNYGEGIGHHATITLRTSYMNRSARLTRRLIIEHELGHAWGLGHDIDTDSVMSDSAAFCANDPRDLRMFQHPWITRNNRRVLAWLYNE